MLKERAALLRRLSAVLDLLFAILAWLTAYYVRFYLLPNEPAPPAPDLLFRYLMLLYFALPLWYALFHLNGMYHSHRTITTLEIISLTGRSIAEGIVILILITFFLKVGAIYRTFLPLFGVSSFVFLVVERLLLKQLLARIRYRGYNYRRILIVGTGNRARAVASKIRDHGDWGLKIVGFLSTNSEEFGMSIEGSHVVGALDDLQNTVSANPIDEVHIAVPLLDLDSITRILEVCEEQGIRTRLMLDLYSPTISKVHLEDFHGTPMLTFTASPMETWEMFIKETIDRLAAIILLVLLIPLFLVVSLLIKLNSRGPIFFVQERVGLYKRRFLMFKFRTMVKGAENMQSDLSDQNEITGPVFKIKNDPRCTFVGRGLRKLSLDELPQILNVLKGEMSFIGPRPPIPAEVQQYKPWQFRRLSMKPGISGLWQVSGRSEIDFDKWMQLDLQYIDNWSLKLDLIIFLKTFPAVLLGRGAS